MNKFGKISLFTFSMFKLFVKDWILSKISIISLGFKRNYSSSIVTVNTCLKCYVPIMLGWGRLIIVNNYFLSSIDRFWSKTAMFLPTPTSRIHQPPYYADYIELPESEAITLSGIERNEDLSSLWVNIPRYLCKVSSKYCDIPDELTCMNRSMYQHRRERKWRVCSFVTLRGTISISLNIFTSLTLPVIIITRTYLPLASLHYKHILRPLTWRRMPVFSL